MNTEVGSGETRNALFSHFAGDLHALEAQREADFLEALDDPERSFAAQMRSRLEDLDWIAPGEDTQYENRLLAHSSSLEALQYIAILGDSYTALLEESKTDPKALARVAEELRQDYYKAPDDRTRISTIFSLAFFAALSRPEGTITSDRLKKGGHKTPEEQGFRVAIRALGAIHKPSAKIQQAHPVGYQHIHSPAARNTPMQYLRGQSPGADEDRAAYNMLMIEHTLPIVLAKAVTDSPISGAELREQVEWYKQRYETPEEPESHPQGIELSEPLPPTEETGWEILPKAVLQKLGIDKPTDPDSRPERPRTKEERLIALGRFALEWYNGDIDRVRIAVRKMGASKSDEFQVAILEETLPDGRVLEHAIAEASDGRATRVWRDEKGWDANGRWLGWQTVFASNKKDAGLLGADWIKHNQNYSFHLLNAMTRPPEELDQPLYRR